MKILSRAGLFTALLFFAFGSAAQAHCEIPCGIYGDEMRIKMMNEHLITIGKSMRMIKELQAEDPVNYNQLVRWVMNKEDHANKFQEIVSQYWLTQRIKAGDADYDQKLRSLHQMLVSAMKCKQTTEQQHVDELHGLIHEFEELYFKE